MGFEKRTIRIAIITVVSLVVIGTVLGVPLSLLSSQRESHIKLEVFPVEDDSGQAPLIHYSMSDPKSWQPWVTRINEFLKEYHSKENIENRVSCTANMGPQGEQVCDVPVDNFHPCTANNDYNFGNKGGPCIFLRLNKVLNWTPQPYNNSEELPANMPPDLRQYIENVLRNFDADSVWVTCEGLTMADKENIGPVMYIPQRGFPAFYYPFTDKKGYLSPLVAVLFERPMTDIVIGVECKAWAKNIDQPLSSVQLELLVDS